MLDSLFERIIAEHPEYEPRALSTSPYVLHLQNFLSADEAAAFQRVCAKSFERSLAGDQLSPVRTSHQCWCADHNACARSPLTAIVEERVRNVTGTPSREHMEPFQVLKY